MAKQSGIKWVKPPAELQKAIREYGDRAWVAIEGVARYWATDIQNTAKRKDHAKWEDRTGNARTGLFSDVERTSKGVRVVLGHTMKYGVHLECGRGGKWATIMPTIEEKAPELERMLQDLVGG